MAHKESELIEPTSNYALGSYSFSVQNVVSEGERVIQAHISGPEGNAAKGITVPTSTQLAGWYVEANETEATVYAVIQIPKDGSEKESDLNTGISQPILLGGKLSRIDMGGERTLWYEFETNTAACFHDSRIACIVASPSPVESMLYGHKGNTYTGSVNDLMVSIRNSFTHNGKTVYYDSVTHLGMSSYSRTGINDGIPQIANVAWTIVYGEDSGGTDYDTKEIMIGRFAIDLEDAGGVVPGSDWIDPGDYDPDWEEGDPTHTLYVTVTGALSGRHNDPIVDPSYSYIPANKDTIKEYGCGGDGGHGGGGGAGASTVVVHKFSTNHANSKEVTAIARRHGYGSGGGKGGRGGDGIILIYY